MKEKVLQQIKERRQALGIKITHMPAYTGLGREQYSAIEHGGNPGLSILVKIAEGLQAEIMLIPNEKADQVRQLLGLPLPPVVEPDDD